MSRLDGSKCLILHQLSHMDIAIMTLTITRKIQKPRDINYSEGSFLITNTRKNVFSFAKY